MIERRQLIRHIACSFDGYIVAVAEFERFVQIWDIQSSHRVAQFETTLDFGGSRLAISRDGRHCAVGAYRFYGVALYDATSGAEVWRRKDLKKVQIIRISKDDRRVLCGFDDKSFEFLDLDTGRSKQTLRGVRDVWESPYDPVIIFDRKRRDYELLVDEDRPTNTIPKKTFAAIDFAFAPQKLCVTESGGTIRCFDITNGKQRWEHDPGNGIHALALAYNESVDEFAAVTWNYENGGPHQLIRLDVDTGTAQTIAHINGAYEPSFCCKGSLLLTADGNLRDAATAEIRAVLEFFPNGENAA